MLRLGFKQHMHGFRFTFLTYPRIWFSGPRILGLIRPGISFSTSEFTKPSRRKRGGEPSDLDSRELEPPPKFAEYPLGCSDDLTI
jgi:hypothetical protein